VLSQFYSIQCHIDFIDYKSLERGNFRKCYDGPLAELPIAIIPQFVDEIIDSEFWSFPYLPPPELRYPKNPWQPGKILPEFRDFLTAFLEHIADYTVNSWREYYARHTIDLARAYVTKRTDHTNRTDHALSEDEYERLVHECDYHLYNFLKSQLASTDPILRALHPKYSIETGTQTLFL